ncbi:MAG: S9 family peptidase, partial [Nevskiales bacterium]|nr:S9 family peptidase [Nevskiales bacterium]
QVRETDFAANKGVNGVWLLNLEPPQSQPRRLTAQGVDSHTPRWSPDGPLYFLSARAEYQQVWRLDLDGGEAVQVTHLPLDVNAFAVAPNGKTLMLSLDVFTDCADLACTRQRLDERATAKATGQLYDKLFIRHWDTWKNDTRAQLFLAALDASGRVSAEPRRLSVGIDGDVPTQPFGGDEEFVFTPDGGHVIFTARIAGKTEAWSTNTDLWRVPVSGAFRPENLTAGNPGYDTGPTVSPDGRTLAYRSMKRAGFEADRFRILLRALDTGATREIFADWDRSAWALKWSTDGQILYVTADDRGQTPLFALDVKNGKIQRLTGAGTVSGFDVGPERVIYAQDRLDTPAQLFLAGPAPDQGRPLTRHNAEPLSARALGEFEPFTFSGWNNETVHGYVMKPARFVRGRKYPVAFIIHGGPQGSMGNHWHYRWNPQTYAGRGYAVVFIDFHGSTGYGQTFTDSISGDWGGKPLEDLQKGWAYALKTYDFLDGSRACALGASYGGYLVNWIAGQWPDPWKCLVNHDGVFDNRMMGYSTEELWFDEWEMGGTPYEKPENVERHNPVNHVAKWETPMLVIHGGLDFRVPLEQGIATFTALQRRGIPSQFLYFPDENHWVLKPQNSLQWHDTVQHWLDRWLK